MHLKGSTAIITGAAHRVGRGIALALAEEGCNIIVHYGKSETKANETVSLLKELGVEATAYSVNLESPKAITEFMTNINQNYSYQLLINSAASFIKSPIQETSLLQWETAINTNVRAPFLLIQQAIDQLNQFKDSLIVNIADLSGIYPWLNFAAHGVSKSGLIHLTKIAARELSPRIRVNAIVPGPILPPLGMSESSEIWQDMVRNVPLQKSGTPSQIGSTVIYLAKNSFITGTVINVDGGEGLVGPKNH